MDTCFKAKQSVEILVPPEPLPITAYLYQSARIVQALAVSGGEGAGVEPLGGERFRLKLKPIGFLTLTLQPIVDLRVWLTADQTLNVESIDCQILGLEQFDDPQFSLTLTGEMYVLQTRKETKLQGQVNLQVNVEMPMPIALTPKPILERTGNAIMLGVLTTMKQRLMKNLIVDYREWAKQPQSLVSGVH
jgi:hypothetical protein